MTSGGTWWTAVTREFDCAVTAVIAQRTSISKSVKTRTSRVSPAPPLESVPAITRTAGRTLIASGPECDERHILVALALQRPSGAPGAYAGSAAEHYARLVRKGGFRALHGVDVDS
jgi:hypothetical protein